MRMRAGILTFTGLLVLLTSCTDDTDAAQQFADTMVSTIGNAGSPNKDAVHDMLRGRGLPEGVSTDSVLDKLLLRSWEDDGAAVGTMFAWIEQDARSGDTATATRAGESAFNLAHYLSTHATEVLNTDGSRTASIGEVNPRAAQGIAGAVTPYISNLSGLQGTLTSPAFGEIDGNDPTRRGAQNIFSVAVSDRDSAARFVGSVLVARARIVDEFLNHKLDSQPTEGLAAGFGVLTGLIERGTELEADDRGKDKYGDSLGLPGKDRPRPYVDPLRPTAVSDSSYDFATALQARFGPLEHSPAHDYLFGADGNLKDLDTLVTTEKHYPTTVYNDIYNFVQSFRESFIQDAVLQFQKDARAAQKTVEGD